MATPYRPFETREAVLAYDRGTPVRSALLGQATHRMLDAANLRPGTQVLDIGTGPGVTAIMAAERVQPGGLVLAIDASQDMIDQATARIRQSRAANLEVRLMDGSRLELDDGSFDAVIGRNAMQFLPAWPEPLGGFRRVLRPGGRLAFMVWGPSEQNPFFDLPASVGREGGFIRIPTAALRIPYMLASAPLDQQLRQAGFTDVALDQARGEVDMAEVGPLLAYLRESPMYRAIAAELDEDERTKYDQAVVAALDRLRHGAVYHVASLSLVASGSR